MEKLAKVSIELLDQLSQIVISLQAEDFQRPSPALSQSSIGQHVRHILEFFICLENGYKLGVVNYDQRQRDHRIEADPDFAASTIEGIRRFVNKLDAGHPLRLEVSYSLDGSDTISIPTNLPREIAYNIEHAVHHMALIKIGLREISPTTKIPDDFGVAVSTVRHRTMLPA